MSKDISIIIPAYNAEKTILASINSLKLDEKWEYSLEVIVVNDGSSDNTSEIVNHYIETYDSIKLINKKNGGVSSARNEGLKNSNGRYVFFLDADDECNRECLEKMISCADMNNVSCVIANYNRLNLIDNEVSLMKNDLFDYNRIIDRDEIENTILLGFFQGGHSVLPSLWNKIYRLSDIFNNHITFDEKRTHGEDWAFNIDFFESVTSCFAINDTGYTYRIDGTQTYCKYSKNLLYSLLDGYDRSVKLNKNYFFYDTNSDEYRLFEIRFLGQIIDFLKLEKISIKEKKMIVKSNQVNEVVNDFIKIPISQYYKYYLGRRNKIGFLFLKIGLYNSALKYIVL